MNTMRTISPIVALLVSSFAFSTASATTMTYDGMGLSSVVRVHASGVNVLTDAGQMRIGYEGQNYLGYCVEIYQDAGTADVTELPVSSLQNGDMVAYLYETYHAGADTGLKAAALQVAIWEVINESAKNAFNAGSGKFHISQNSDVRKLANEWLSTLPNSYQLPSSALVLHSPTNQDVLIGSGRQVPEPACLAVLALGGMVMMARRKHFA